MNYAVKKKISVFFLGSFQKGQGIYIATHSFTYVECQFLASILTKIYNFKTSVIKSGHLNQWKISIPLLLFL